MNTNYSENKRGHELRGFSHHTASSCQAKRMTKESPSYEYEPETVEDKVLLVGNSLL